MEKCSCNCSPQEDTGKKSLFYWRKTCDLICHYVDRYGYNEVSGNHYSNRNNYNEEEEELLEEDNGQEMEMEETADTRKR